MKSEVDEAYQKMELKGLGSEQHWRHFKGASSDWLGSFYSKQGDVSPNVIKQTQRRHNQKMDKICGMFNEDYLRRFKEQRERSYITFKVTACKQNCIEHDFREMRSRTGGESELSSSLVCTRAPQESRKITNFAFYINFKEIVRLLSNDKYHYRNIVKHYFIQEQESKEPSFTYEMERGVPLNNLAFDRTEKPKTVKEGQTEKTQTVNPDKKEELTHHYIPLVAYMVARDVAKAILQLEAQEIYYYDLQTRNIVCVGVEAKCLGGGRQMMRRLREAEFKLIDVEHVFVMSEVVAGRKEDPLRSGLHRLAMRIFEAIGSMEFRNYPPKALDVGGVINRALIKPEQYKQRHREKFQAVMEQFGRNGCVAEFAESQHKDKNKNKDREIYDAIIQCIRSRDYRGLIKQMDAVIAQIFKDI